MRLTAAAALASLAACAPVAPPGPAPAPAPAIVGVALLRRVEVRTPAQVDTLADVLTHALPIVLLVPRVFQDLPGG